ncbi:NUDIX domain-containing protein [Candidatus Daviesbacteria bacterium]|nr:NUDIX domain-containing protein [Candidatus Daviesbacteria bacterium]
MLQVVWKKPKEKSNFGLAMTNQYLHEVVITAIIVKNSKYLIIRRSLNKKRFPGYWTVPGGKLETKDYVSLPKDTQQYWYNVLEKTLEREVKEEVGIEIINAEYVTSLATVHSDGAPSIVISCMASYKKGKVILQKEEADSFAWVTLKEAKKYDLIDGIYEELVMVDRKRHGQKTKWSRGREN